MRGLIVGSHAMQDALRDYTILPKDLDIFSPDMTQDPPYIEVFWHPSFEDWIPEGILRHATLDECYTIKLSHLGWDPPGVDWEKHIYHAQLLRDAGAKVDSVLYDLLVKVWEEKHGPKKVDFNRDKEEFFTPGVRRVYEHDSLHDSVAYTPGEPLYRRFLKDGAEVQLDMAAVKAAPLPLQRELFREETYVIALERWVIPSDYMMSPGLAYRRALKKMIVDLSKGWTTRFLLENYREMSITDGSYVDWHLQNKDYLRKV